MTVYILVAITAIIALLVDVYIYKRVISRHNFGKVWKVGYLIYAVVTDIAVLASFIMYRTVVDWDDTILLRIVMSIIGLFFLNVVPKTMYAVISLGDYVVQKIRHERRISHIFGYTGTLAAILAFGFLFYSMTWGRSDIRVERVELEFADLPESFDGFTIAQFSDSHIGTALNIKRFNQRMVDIINDLDPDIVVNSGDLVNAYFGELSDEVLEIFAGLKSRYGIYSVIGNHDLGIYIKNTERYPPQESLAEVIRLQEQLGWKVLRNQSVWLSNGRDSITITGIDYPEDNTLNSHSKEIEGADVVGSYLNVPDSVFNLTISHAPQIWDEIRGQGKADLTISGHVHAMQMKFRIGSWIWSPAMLSYDRWSGLYEEDGRYLYINDGMGAVVFPMRINVRPEVSLITLRKKRE